MASDIILDGKNAQINADETSLCDAQGTKYGSITRGNLNLGAPKKDGDLVLLDATGSNSIHLDAGGVGSKAKGANVYIDGKGANMFIGAKGTDGDIVLIDSEGHNTIHLNAGGKGSKVSGTPVYLHGQKQLLELGKIKLDGKNGMLTLSETIFSTPKPGSLSSLGMTFTIELNAAKGTLTGLKDISLPGISSLVKKIESLEKRLAEMEATLKVKK